jgi:hypothetical protein
MATSNSRPRSVQVRQDLPKHRYLDPQEKTRLKKHDRRGNAFVDHAIAFAQRFPLNEENLIEQFDEWAQERGLYPYPKGTDTKSDAWKAMLRRRDETINGINAAAETENMQRREVGAFFILRRYKHFRRVLPGTHAAQIPIRLDRVASQTMRIREQLQDALIAQGFVRLPQTYQDYVEDMYQEMLDFEKEIAGKAESKYDKFMKLVRRMGRDAHRGLVSFDDPIMQGLIAVGLISTRAEDRHLYDARIPLISETNGVHDTAGDTEDEPFC